MSDAEVLVRHSDVECSGEREHKMCDLINLHVHVLKEGKKTLHEVLTSCARLVRLGDFFVAQIDRWLSGAVTITLAELEWQAFRRYLAGETLKRNDVFLLLRIAADYCLAGLENEVGRLEIGECRNCKLKINGINLKDHCYVRYNITDYVTCTAHCVYLEENV